MTQTETQQKHLKENFTKLQTGIFLLKDLKEYIESSIRLECFLNFRFLGNNFIIEVFSQSKNHKKITYSFVFDINDLFIERPIHPETFFKRIDQYIVEANDYFKKEYAK